MMKCKYCLTEISGQRRKFCCHNHKTSFYKKEIMKRMQTLKKLIPEMFEEGYEWSDTDANQLRLFFQHKNEIQKIIDILIEEKNEIKI